MEFRATLKHKVALNPIYRVVILSHQNLHVILGKCWKLSHLKFKIEKSYALLSNKDKGQDSC